MLPERLSKFEISDADLEPMPEIYEAFMEWCRRRYELSDALKALKAASEKLRALLDVRLRAKGLVPEGMDWNFREGQDGLLIEIVLPGPKRRGRPREQIPLQRLSP